MSIDLDNFPTSESAKRMMSRVTPIYKDSYVGKWLFEVMGLELDEARRIIENISDQCFVEKATWGLRYWEERYGIPVDETKSLDARRKAVLAKKRRAAAMSPAALDDILESLTSRDIEISETTDDPYTFAVQIGEGTNVVDIPAVIEKINSTKPSHLAYEITFPRKGSITICVGVAVHLEKDIKTTTYDKHVGGNENYLVDEDGYTLIDEDGYPYVDD